MTGTLLARRPGLPVHEATVLVPDTLLPEVAVLHIPDLSAHLDAHHTRDLLRVEMLDRYDVPSDDDDYHRYLRGDPAPDAAAKAGWLDRLRAGAAAGRARRRVRIVREPLSDYDRFECEWCFTDNTAAGEDIRVLAGDFARVPDSVGDFFVIDAKRVARLRYDADHRFTGAYEVGVADTPAYVAVAEMAWSAATPFPAWWAAHPQYHRGNRAA